MDFTYTPLVWPSAGASVLALCLVLFTFIKGNSPASRLFSLCLLTVFLWIVTDLLEKTGLSFETKMLWRKLSYLPIGFLPVFWLLLVLRLTRNGKVTVGFVILLSLIPTAFAVGAWTNDWNHLHWSAAVLRNGPWGSFIEVKRGPLFILNLSYSIALQLSSIVLLALACRSREPLFVRQFLGFLIGQLIVFVPNILYVLSIPPFDTVDLTPLALGLASVAMAWGIFRFRSLDVVPQARSNLLESVSIPWFLLDEQNRLVDRNAKAEEFLGLDDSKLSGNLLTIPSVPEGLKGFLRTRASDSGEFEVEGTFWEIHGGWIEVGREGMRAYGVFLVDVTEVRSAQSLLHQQEKALVVLHERERLSRELHDSLGQQLGFLNLSAQALYKSVEDNNQRASLSGLRKIAEVAKQAHEDVRYFIQASSGSLNFAQGSLAAFRDLVEHFASTYEYRVDLEVDSALGDDFLGQQYQHEVFRIIQEAINNSRKHAHTSSVVLRLVRLVDRVRIAVVDSGVGFDPESRLDSSGFGLNIMKERARLNGLELKIESSPGAGTRVILEVPSLTDHVQLSEPALVHDRSGTKILVVDDNRLFVEGLLSVLAMGGYSPAQVAYDAETGIKIARETNPNLVLLDIQMPVLDGLALARTIHLEMPAIKIVMLTVSASDSDLFEALRVGASAYLLKSFRAEDLFSTIDGLMRGEVAFTPAMAAKIIEEGRQKGKGSDRVEHFTALTQRQEQVLFLAAQGQTYKEIGVKLNLSERTIKYHMGEILERLHLKSRAEATRWFRRPRGPLDS